MIGFMDSTMVSYYIGQGVQLLAAHGSRRYGRTCSHRTPPAGRLGATSP
jgi:hypothetical protein